METALVTKLGRLTAEARQILLDDLLVPPAQVRLHLLDFLRPGPALLKFHVDVLDGGKPRCTGDLERVPGQLNLPSQVERQ